MFILEHINFIKSDKLKGAIYLVRFIPYQTNGKDGPLLILYVTVINSLVNMTETIGSDGREEANSQLDKTEVRKAVRTNSFENLNRLAIGAIEVDKNGRILEFSEAESKLSDLSKEEVIGKNFFTEVATCTNYGEFKSNFNEIVEGEREEATFDFLLTHLSPPVKVRVMLKRSVIDQNYWIIIKRKD